MKTYIKERVVLLCEYTLQTHAPIRVTAKQFGLSKSTVHIDLSKRLKFLNKKAYYLVKKVLDQNFSEKHIRGGISTKNKFKKQK